MKELSLQTKLYMAVMYFLGLGLLTWNVLDIHAINYWMVIVLSVLASFFLIFKVVGATNRSDYTFSFLIYGFAFAYFGLGGTLVVILVSNLVEWAWKRPRWYIQLFNIACYISVMFAAFQIFKLIDPPGTLSAPIFVLAIVISMAVFTLLNHFLVGIIVWLANGENFKISGVFDTFPLLLDLTFLIFGAMLTMLWKFNPYAITLVVFPLYLIYETLRIPALERKTEVDAKTGLFNHQYFMLQLSKELDRSNRFDRPLSIMMLDLDLLRNINNTYGHLAGDEVLIGVAQILKRSVREYDVVARFGGEEFIIMLPETTVQQSFERAEVIRRDIEAAEFTVPTSVTPIQATISLGLAERESFTQTTEEIIHNADTALYHSKLSGRNKTFAYRNDAYLDFFGYDRKDQPPSKDQAPAELNAGPAIQPAGDYSAAETKFIRSTTLPETEDTIPPEEESSKSIPEKSQGQFQPVYLYIGGLAVLAFSLVYGLYRLAPEFYQNNWVQIWPGLLISMALVLLTELYSIDLYISKTSLSTSAVPILAGTLLFGPLAGVVLCATYAVIVGIKYRSKFNKYVFNFSNQLIAAMFYLFALHFFRQPLADFSIVIQSLLVVMSALIVYMMNTWLISIGMGIALRQSPRQIWKEQYLWLVSIYVGIGLIATAYIVGYREEGVIGILLMMVPLLLLRISQKQYVDHTRQAVTELREKNLVLEKNAAEINHLNDGLLNTLAEIIDLRDPNVLGHSKRVTAFAVQIAEKMGLNPKQVKLIYKASLLHDIGKLGISMEILKKPGKLNSSEYETVKKHAALGGNLVKNSPSLLPLFSIIRHHHEFFNGKGYPDNLSGDKISIEAKVVSVADAVEAMTSDRPYRKRLKTEQVIDELKRCSGSQFDPDVTASAIRLLEKVAELEAAGSASQLQPALNNKTKTQTS